MSKFIELTNAEGKKVTVNSDHIIYMWASETGLGTVIYINMVLSGGGYRRLEAAEDYAKVRELLD